MTFDADIHHRRSIRLRDYNYTHAGAYFVTICTFERECFFGTVLDGVVLLNDLGQIVANCWDDIPNHFPHVELDAIAIMPNHLHGIIVLTDNVQPVSSTFGAIIRSLKSAVTKRINALNQGAGSWSVGSPHAAPDFDSARENQGATCGASTRGGAVSSVWQRNYYERIIRDERELLQIRQYIIDNPLKWDEDENHPKP